jgi:signal transduction histidine kinase
VSPDARLYEQRELVYLAICRVLAVLLYVSILLIEGEGFTLEVIVVGVVAAAYTSGTLWLALSRHWETFNPRWLIPLDLLVIGAGVAASGGPDSAVRVVFFAWAIAMALLYPPRTVLWCAFAAMVAMALFGIPFVVAEPGAAATEDLRSLATGEVALVWIGLVTFFTADAFQRRADRIQRLSAARQRLLTETLSAEERARRRLSQSLHDDALQVLLAAGQDLDAGLRGDRPLLERAREEVRLAVRKIRETIKGLHPAALEHGGLAGGIDSAVERAADRGGFSADVRVDRRASGVHDALLLSIAGELATNAAKHADADVLSVQLTRDERSVTLDVADDGRGMTPLVREAALSAGHIGLASCIERVEAANGEIRIDSEPGGGTRVRVTLPAPRLDGANSAAGARRNGGSA